MNNPPSVRDHLTAVDPHIEEWIVELAALILITLDCDPAMAASRARDLSRQEGTARGLKDLISGWVILRTVDGKGLTALQQSTLKSILGEICKSTSQNLSAQ